MKKIKDLIKPSNKLKCNGENWFGKQNIKGNLMKRISNMRKKQSSGKHSDKIYEIIWRKEKNKQKYKIKRNKKYKKRLIKSMNKR